MFHLPDKEYKILEKALRIIKQCAADRSNMNDELMLERFEWWLHSSHGVKKADGTKYSIPEPKGGDPDWRPMYFGR